MLLTAMLFTSLALPERAYARDGSMSQDVFGYAEKYEELMLAAESEDKISVEEFFGMSDQSENYTQTETASHLRTYLESLPDEAAALLPPIDEENGSAYESFTFDFFIHRLSDAVGAQVTPFKRTLFQVLGIILLSFAAGRFCDGMRAETGQAVGIVCAASVCLVLVGNGVFDLRELKSYLTSLSDVSTAMLPTVTMLLAATGNVTAAALTGQSMTLLCTVLEYLFSRVVFPLIAFSSGLCITGCIFGEKTAMSLSALLHKTASFVTVFFMSLLVFVTGVRSTLAAAADSIGIRTVKFAVGSFIPYVGGAVSEAVNAVGAGLGYVKNTCGIISVVVIFLLMLPPLISILLSKAVLGISCCVAQILDCSIEARLLSQLGGIYNCMLALIVSASVVFIFVLVTVISCGVRIGGF